MDAAGFAFAALTGASVVGVTLLADRLGGRAGGLLATAPVTTTAAHVVITTSVATDVAPFRILQGANALLASTLAIVFFFYAVKFTRGRAERARLAAGFSAYLAVFVPTTLLLARAGIPWWAGFTLLFLVQAALAFSFMREPVPVLQGYVPKRSARSALELATRFASGAGVVLLIRALVHAFPTLAGALAVVPAVFLVSLAVMGVHQSAPFAARAAQAGLFGTAAVALFVLSLAATLAALAPALPLLARLTLGVALGWAAYFAALAALGKAHARLQDVH